MAYKNGIKPTNLSKLITSLEERLKDIGVSDSVITDMTGKLIDYHKNMGQLKCSIRSSKLVTNSALRKQDNFVVQSLRNGRCR